MTFSQTDLNLLLENLLFLIVSTSFFGFLGWVWRHSKPFSLPQPLPSWLKAWIYFVQVVGVLLPLIATVLGGVWWGERSVLQAFVPYFVMLGFQILLESLTLRQFHSCVWVIVPYLYVPYRVWQLYEGLTILNLENGSIWIQRLLIAEIVIWVINYGVDLSQLPRLFRWELNSQNEVAETPSR